jgi:hypothetical protein
MNIHVNETPLTIQAEVLSKPLLIVSSIQGNASKIRIAGEERLFNPYKYSWRKKDPFLESDMEAVWEAKVRELSSSKIMWKVQGIFFSVFFFYFFFYFLSDPLNVVFDLSHDKFG